MSLGILTSTLRALKNVRNHPYVEYIGVNLATLVQQTNNKDYSHVYSRKSRLQLIKVSAAVCGIELCYAAETAFVSPILLRLGVPVAFMTLVWCLSPLLGFFLVPLFGSMSDRCKTKLGRRRPFILFLSAGILLGLILVPNGEKLGELLGDPTLDGVEDTRYVNKTIESLDVTTINIQQNGVSEIPAKAYGTNPNCSLDDRSVRTPGTYLNHTSKSPRSRSAAYTLDYSKSSRHLIGIGFTIVGVAMLDFNCDACQSPCRAYLLDISVPDDHSPGLTTFTVMAGIGGSIGYLMGGIDWNSIGVGTSLYGHVQVVFIFVLIAFCICVFFTVTSFKEIPLEELGITTQMLQHKKKRSKKGGKYTKFTNDDDDDEDDDTEEFNDGVNKENYIRKGDEDDDVVMYSVKEGKDERETLQNRQPGTVIYGSVSVSTELENTSTQLGNYPSKTNIDNLVTSNDVTNIPQFETLDRAWNTPTGRFKHDDVTDSSVRLPPPTQPVTIEINTDVTLKTYLLSIIRMPKSILILCVTNLFCWMSLVCYSLYFTDFVGQSVYGGDPRAEHGTTAHALYEDGVRMGSFGMALYSASCAAYSWTIDYLIKRFKARPVYICGQLVYTVGMLLLAMTRSRAAVILLSPTAGIMYATLFTMPYLLVAHYHTSKTFDGPGAVDEENSKKQVRGLGTDIALVSSMVFLAQFVLSLGMGAIIHAVGSTVAVVIVAAILSFCGALCATQVMYLDL